MSSQALHPQDGVAALLVLEDGRYLLQHRDARSDIFYPDHWGLFGGAIERGERELEALARELEEELALVLDPRRARYFTSWSFDLEFAGRGTLKRVYYEVSLRSEELSCLRLGEGREMRVHRAEELLENERVVPYDAWALWLHLNRARIRTSGSR